MYRVHKCMTILNGTRTRKPEFKKISNKSILYSVIEMSRVAARQRNQTPARWCSG